MTTVAARQPTPVPDKAQSVRFTLSGAGANFIRVWCTSAPEGSKLALQLAAHNASRVQVYEGPGGTDAPWLYTFDKGGKYTLVTQEYTQAGGWGGGYEGDPRGALTETKVGIESTLTLYIAQRMAQRLGVGEDAATLLLYALNSTIVQTYAGVHKEASPVIVDPKSDRAKAAAEAKPTTDEVAALIGMSVSNALGTLDLALKSNINLFTAHTQSGLYHQNADSQADLYQNYAFALASPEGVAVALNKLRLRFSQHIQNSKENDSTHPEWQLPGGVLIHDGTGRFDLTNKLMEVTANANDPPTVYAALADYWRAYEAHRVSDVHETPDNPDAFDPNNVGQITKIHMRFMTSLAAMSPTVPPGQSSGAANLIAQAGFVEG